jgi:replicative DNA helicase
VSFHHLKQPAAEVGPFQVLHNDITGRSTIWHEVDLVELARAKESISAMDAAKAINDTEKPTVNEKQKARRRLDALVGSGHLWVFDKGDESTSRPRLWAAT